MIIGIHGAVIERKKLLLVRKGEIYIFPGGKMEQDETEEQCLKREFREELRETEINVLDFYGDFDGLTPFSRRMIRSRVYFAEIAGELKGVSSTDKINGYEFVSFDSLKNFTISDISRKVIAALHKDKYF